MQALPGLQHTCCAGTSAAHSLQVGWACDTLAAFSPVWPHMLNTRSSALPLWRTRASSAEGARLQDVIVSERRFQYEAEVATNPLNYDTWFDYVRLEEAAGDPERVRLACQGVQDLALERC